MSASDPRSSIRRLQVPPPPARQARTDLAIETLDDKPRHRPRGVDVQEERDGRIAISRVHITSVEGERLIGKPRGWYVTIDAPDLRQRNSEVQEQVARRLAGEIARLLPLKPDAKVFVVGLGNWHATPDALGPKVVAALLVTRHLADQVPEDLRGQLRSVAALAPGVLGITGIETGEIIRGIVDSIRPDAVVVVDALASRSIERILRTIQLSDTGIQPGSGVGNHRAGIDQEALGIPVLAIGVPTVVHAATIAADTIDLLARKVEDPDAARALQSMGRSDRRQMIAEVLHQAVGELMVTPKEIDLLIEDMAKVVAAGVDAALHPQVAAQDALLPS